MAARIMPELAVRPGRAAIGFYVAAYGAVVEHQVGGTDDDAPVVAQLAIGDAAFWVAHESPEHGSSSPQALGGASARMLLVVEDPVAVAAQAVAAGAVEHAPVEEAHGWLVGR